MLPGDCATPQELELVALVNEYRVQNVLMPVTPARWLSTTAQWHLWDRVNNPGAVGGMCSTHSWSANPPTGVFWTPVCWTAGQSTAMWIKPNEISAGAYTGNGFELTADCGCTMTATQALLQWQGSPAHNPVILQQGVWSGIQFTGVGVAIVDGFAVLWFGDGGPNGGALPACEQDQIFSAGFE